MRRKSLLSTENMSLDVTISRATCTKHISRIKMFTCLINFGLENLELLHNTVRLVGLLQP